jgi:hypothetical protein
MMESVGARIGGKLGFEIWKKGEGWNQAKAVMICKEKGNSTSKTHTVHE